MPRIGGFIGAFLLFSAFALLLVATISAPVFRQISLLNVYQGGQQTNFGTFGYCLQSGCTGSRLGYDLPGVVNGITGTNGNFSNEAVRRLTNALILHPIACGIAFLAFLIALFAHRIGFLVASLFSILAFFTSLVVMAIDFAIFTIARNHINNQGGNISAMFGNAIWMVLAATVALFLAAFATCFSCCAARRERRYDETAADRRYIYRNKQVGVPEMYAAEADRMGLDATGRRSAAARY